MEIATPPHSPLSTRRSSSRRSFPNLTHLSLAPLSSRFPIDDDDAVYDDALQGTTTFSRTSYIEPKTAPTTPGILSRSHSPNRPRKSRRKGKVAYVHEAHLSSTKDPSAPPTKAKSTSVLNPPGHTPLTRSGTATPSILLAGPHSTSRRSRHHSRRSTADDDFLHRVGMSISSQALESKGQSWLVRRASSTASMIQSSNTNNGNLSRNHSHQQLALLSGEQFIGHADDEYSPVTPRYPSRYASRAGSAKGSRRGSRTNLGFMTPLGGARTPGTRRASNEVDQADYFETQMPLQLEPDFVLSESDSEEDYDPATGGVLDEDEIARLAQEQTFGFGGLVDRLIGWTLFSVNEDGEETEEEEEHDSLLQQVEAARVRVEPPVKKVPAPAPAVQPPVTTKGSVDGGGEQTEAEAREGGWQDAAWLLSVASKVLL